jgi:protein-L-isoaspartate(D-aspartate) O-methyltransferase
MLKVHTFLEVPMYRRHDSICGTLMIALCIVLLSWIDVLGADERTADRAAMVEEQIIERGVKDATTLAAMRSVPRHLFVPANLSSSAYQDRPLPIGHGQTISQPFIVAFMTEIIKPGPGRKILEIGTGSGYQAAVLAATGAEVFSIEIIPKLAESGAARLKKLGFENVTVKAADGYYGWPEQAPFDAIIVTAAAEFIPPPLIEQLAESGLMIIPVGSPFFVQTLMLLQKRDGKAVSANLMPVRFVPFKRAQQ